MFELREDDPPARTALGRYVATQLGVMAVVIALAMAGIFVVIWYGPQLLTVIMLWLSQA